MDLISWDRGPQAQAPGGPLFGSNFVKNPYKTCFKLHFGGSIWVAPWPTPAKDFPQAQPEEPSGALRPRPRADPFLGTIFAQNPYKTCVKMHFGGIFMGRALAGPLKGFF